MSERDIGPLSMFISLNDHERKLDLESLVTYLLSNSTEKLAWMLYRLDVDESELKERIAQDPKNESTIIADQIMAKLKKINLRKKPKEDQSPDWSFDLED